MTGNENNEGENENDLQVSSKVFWLFAVGFVLVFIGVLAVLMAVAFGAGDGSASAGVVIFIGPFPIVFGVGPDATLLIVIGVILAVISVVLFVMMRKRIG